jgi:hypothetical protein
MMARPRRAGVGGMTMLLLIGDLDGMSQVPAIGLGESGTAAPLRYALSKNISMRGLSSGKAHRRSLGFARDDKGESSAHLSSRYMGWTEPQVIRDFHLLRWAKGP